jgi:V8-like Glu-specific endopeptidase
VQLIETMEKELNDFKSFGRTHQVKVWRLKLNKASNEEIEALWREHFGEQLLDSQNLGFVGLTNRFSKKLGRVFGIIGKNDAVHNSALANPSPTMRLKLAKTADQHNISKTSEVLLENMRHAIKSVAAVVLSSKMKQFESGEIGTLQGDLKQHFEKPYCGADGELPRLARGTAFLIKPDLLLTAAHNLIKKGNWISDEELVYVFGFRHDGEGQLPRKEHLTVVTGKKILYDMEYDDDWMLVKLDHPVEFGVLRLSNRRLEPPAHPPACTALYAIGYPLGTPLKVAMIGEYVNRRDTKMFTTDLDVFKGNSGSPIINLGTNSLKIAMVALKSRTTPMTKWWQDLLVNIAKLSPLCVKESKH